MRLVRRIRELIGILRSEDLDEIEVRTLWSSVRVARRRMQAAGGRSGVESGVASGAVDGPPLPAPPVPETSAAPEAVPAPQQPPAAARVDEQTDLEEVRSPMVGTFYRAASPESDPYVAEGSRVEVGQVLCVIEAMKLMNEIEAEKSGVIRRVLVKDSQPVEFDQPLFLMESA